MIKHLLLLINVLTYSISFSQLIPTRLNQFNTGANERDFALSQNGNLILFTVQSNNGDKSTIMLSKNIKGKWSKPMVAPFSGQYNDLEPFFSPDNAKVFFCSNRPAQNKSTTDFDIWYVELKENNFGKIIRLDTVINSQHDEFYPSVSKNGNLYFTSQRNNGIGKEDIFLSFLKDSIYQKPIPLDTAINSKGYEFNAFISPDENLIVFTAYGRKDDMGKGDLYYSKKNNANTWSSIKRLPVNSTSLDYCPFIDFKDNKFYFTSNRKSGNYSKTNYETIIKEESSPGNGNGDIFYIDINETWFK